MSSSRMQTSAHPIGIFDSGIGGLTMAHALVKLMPQENYIYFGDTAHLPYGDKSTATIQSYAIRITNFLLEKKCKLILIACNSASAAAYDLIKEYVGAKAKVMNVIDPIVLTIEKNYAGKNLGLIGTRQTVNSSIFQKKIAALNLNIKLSAVTTNLLASAIEEFGHHQIIDEILQVYLQHPNLQQLDALLLACTHYPIVKDKISAIYNQQVEIIDSTIIVAAAVKNYLQDNQLANTTGETSHHYFYVSDFTESFENHAKLFFGSKIHLEHIPLWD